MRSKGKEISMARKKRNPKARRFVKLHHDGSIGHAIHAIEKTFDLPKGSVKITYPSGRKARSDATVGKIKKWWGK